jgi:hypothetical protein
LYKKKENGLPLVDISNSAASFSASIYCFVGTSAFFFLPVILLRASKSGNASVPATTPWGTNSAELGVNDAVPKLANGLSEAVLAGACLVY